MIGVLVISHARLATELVGAAEFILGKIKRVETIDIVANMAPENLRKRLKDAVDRLKEPDGVLVLTDMFGGTPNNVSLAFLEPGKVEVVTGVNLPMIIEAATSRQKTDLKELARNVAQKGAKAISVAGDFLNP